MKRRTKAILSMGAVIFVVALVAGIIWFSMPSEQRNMVSFMAGKTEKYENHKEYQVIDRNVEAQIPSSFIPVAAESAENDYNSNITVVTGMIQNERSKMVKKAMVQPVGIENYTGWQLIADEGFEEGVNTFGPSPLSYLTTGVAANLHTQILRAADVLDVDLENVKVEVLNKFHWEEMLSAEGAGFLGETHINILIESNEPEEIIQELKDIALNAWVAGEALANETIIEPTLVVNGENWNKYRATPGTTSGDESYVDGQRISYITDGPKKSEYLEQVSEEDRNMSFNAMSNLVFEILAISESAEDFDRPYLKKVTVSFNTTRSETWELYSDELHGTDVMPLAPTSLEYLTAGVSLCLTSQLTLVSAMMGLDYTDYRVEAQLDYREENVNTSSAAGYADTVYSYVVIESDEEKERLDTFFNKALSLCFAGEAFKGATDMHTSCYLNGKEIK